MEIKEPKVELFDECGVSVIGHVCRCARVCYGKTEGNDEVLCKNLLKNKHLSMFRHSTVYSIIYDPDNTITSQIDALYKNCPYISYLKSGDKLYIVTNRNFTYDLSDTDKLCYDIMLNEVSKELFLSACKENARRDELMELVRYTFKLTTQISTSRELNRTSPNNIAESSTRYINMSNAAIVCPHWIYAEEIEDLKNSDFANLTAERALVISQYLKSCETGFETYDYLIKNGVKQQDARGVLPLDTITNVVYTYSLKEWKHIIDLRYYGTTGKPHPNAKIIIGMVKDKLEHITNCKL